jgi:hypothetical protein
MKSRLLITNNCLTLCVFLLSININTIGQTNPEPFNLSTGAYAFTAWDSASPAGTFPPNMIFQFVDTNQLAPFVTEGTSDFDCSYNKTKRPRINGLGADGISLLTTSNSQYNNCISGTSTSRFIGAALVSLNASGRGNIYVSWKAQTLIPGDGTPNPRICNLRLQYRLGNSGLFTDVPGPVEFIASTSAGLPFTLGPTLLPAECWNQSVVQVRWIYFESSAGNIGSRPKIRLDDIEITSDIYQGINDNQAYADGYLDIFPNPASGQITVRTDASLQGTIKVLDILGKELIMKTFNSPQNTINCTSLTNGVYFVQVADNKNGLIRTRKLIIRR